MQARWRATLSILALLAFWCAGGRARAVERREITLSPVIVDPAAGGPTMQPPGSLARTAVTVRSAVQALRPALVECYRWARFRQPAFQAATFTVDLRLDHAGTVSRVAVEPPSPVPDGGARACLREVLGTVAVGLYTARLTDVAFTLHLSPSGQGQPRRAPAHPRPAARAPSRDCRATVAPAADRLQLEDERIDDFSQEQARQERREKVRRDHRDWQRGGKVGPEPVDEPDVISGCGNVRGAFTPAALTRGVAANAGAYAACFAVSDQRAGQDRVARVEVTVDLEGDGRFCSARVTGSADGRLARCLEAAVGDVWLPPAVGALPVRLVIPLVRGAPVAAPDPTCAPGVAELRRRLDGSPWLADPRVYALADAVGADAARAPRLADRDGCWLRARELVAGAVMALHKDANKLLNADVMQAAVAGYDWVLAQRPALPDDVNLRFYRAELLWSLERWTDSARAYADVRDRDPGGRFAKDAAYAAVLAWANALGDDTGSCCTAVPPGRRPRADATPSTPRPLSAEESALVNAIDAYLHLVPDAPEAERLTRRKADLLTRAKPPIPGPAP